MSRKINGYWKKPVNDSPEKDKMSYWDHVKKMMRKLPREERKYITEHYKGATLRKSVSKFN